MSEQQAVNLSAALPLDTFDLTITIPGTTKPSGWSITLAGPAHPKTIALYSEAERKRLQRAVEIERAQVNGRKWKGDDLSAEENRRNIVTGIVGRIVDWTPVDFGDGPVAFSEKGAVDLFMQPRMGGFFVQIVEYLASERAFMPASATN